MAEAKQSVEALQAEVLKTQLETAQIALEQTRDQNASYRQKKEAAARQNAEREQGFQTKRGNERRIQRHVCEHRSGGFAGETPVTEGDGPSVLHVTIMPDQVTEFLQCTRCTLKLYGRARTQGEEAKMQAAAEAAERAHPRTFESHPDWLAWDDHLWWKELRQIHKKTGYKKSIMRGPTFSFKTLDGVPVIPEPTVTLKSQIRKLAKAV